MEQNKTSIGSLIAAIIIIAIIVLGGLYFWGKRIEESRTSPTTEENGQALQQTEAERIADTGSSDDTASLEQELNSTVTTGLDTELQSTAQ